MKSPALQSAIIIILAFIVSCKSGSDPAVAPPAPVIPYPWTTFSMGADLSYVNEIEDYGGVYRDSGRVEDPFRILRKHGCNTIRVRLWHNPQWVAAITGGKMYSDLPDVAKTIRRAKENGMAVNLDFHYSDIWADPDHQETPAAWQGLQLQVLKDSVYNYTLKTLQYLNSQDLAPEMVQVGNETNPGMCFPSGQVVNGDWTGFATLLKAGIKAVRDFSAATGKSPKIILHVAQFQNATWWADDLIKKGGVKDFDILGVSHYSKWSTVKRMDIVTDRVRELRIATGKPVMVVETAYPWTGDDADSYRNIIGMADSLEGYPLTPEGQLKYLTDLTQAVINGGGTGVHYWEPAWITSSMKDKWGTGSAWDNCTLFDFGGNALLSMDFMKYPYNYK